MMKFIRNHKFLLVAMFIYVVLAGVIIVNQYHFITNYQYTSLGGNALNLATLAANTLHISDEELQELRECTFEEMLTHPANEELAKMFHLIADNKSIKYAYILSPIPDGQEKYTVDEADTAFYDLPVGTKFDYMWLLDVVVDANQRVEVAQDADYYKDKNRYTVVTGEAELMALTKKENVYFISEGRWGTQISGLVPMYTDEGTYIGVLGIDMYPESFYMYRSSIFWALFALFMIPTIFTSCIYIYLHLRYRKSMTALAYRDQLTGVFNRRYFDSEGGRIFRDAARYRMPVGVIVGDIDDFKLFNDKYGHQEGDAALQLVAGVIESFIAEREGFVARYGGEEFVVVLENPQNIGGLCDDMCKAIANKKVIHMDGSCTQVTISLGVYTDVPENGERLEKFVKKADEAMYRAKKAGKNTFAMELHEVL